MLRKKFSILATALSLCAFLLAAMPAGAQYNAFKDPTSSESKAGTTDFKAVTENILGGKIAVGATAYVVVLFKNAGAAPVKVGSANLYPSSTVSATLALNQCADMPVTSDAQCAMTIAVMGKQPGSWRVEMLVDHDGHSRVATAAISGEVELIAATPEKVTKGDVEISPIAMDFGKTSDNNSFVRSVVLRNRSGDAVRVKGVTLAAPDNSGFTYTSQCPEVLQTDETCNIIVTWKPTLKGVTQGVLVAQHTGKSGMAQVEMKGELQVAEGDIEAAPKMLDFGASDGGLAMVRSVILTNHSSEEVQIWDVAMDAPQKSGYTYQSECPETLQPGESCRVSVTWQPTSVGVAQGVLAARHSGKSGVASVEVRASLAPTAAMPTKEDENVQISPTELDFGTVASNNPLTRSIVLTNNMTQAVSLKDVTLSASKQSGITYNSQCPQSLQIGESCTIIVNWQPSISGLAQGVLVVKHSGKSGMAQTEVKGVYEAPENEKEQVIGTLEMTPSELDFGTSTSGSELVKSFTLKNLSDEDIQVWDIGMNAPSQAGLSYDSQCPETLQPDESCTIIVSWEPSSKGQAQGVLVVKHSGRTGMAQSEITGVFTPPEGEEATSIEGAVEIGPKVLDFGTSLSGNTLIKPLVLTNHTRNDVHIWNIGLNASEKAGLSYTSQCPEALQPEESCNIIVTWNPTLKGQTQGVLTVQHGGKNGSTQAEITGVLQVEGSTPTVEGVLEVTPPQLDFGAVTSASPLVKSIVVSNKTFKTVTVKKVTLDTPEKSGLTYKSQCPATLQADETCTIIVSWQPTNAGRAQGVLVVEHSGKTGTGRSEIAGDYTPIDAEKTKEGDVEVTPDELNMGSVTDNTPLIKTVVVSNNTFNPVTIKKVTMDAAEKSGLTYKTQCPATLQASETCNIIVTWQPTTKGTAQGVLIVEHGGKKGMSHSEITGSYSPAEGDKTQEGEVEVTPGELDMGSVTDNTPLIKTVVVSNHTFKPITVKKISLDTAERSGLSYKTQCPQTLQPSETCNIIVTWQPTSKGTAQGVLVVEHGGKTGMNHTEITGSYSPAAADSAKEGDVGINPDKLDMGSVTDNTPLVKSIVVSNDTFKTIGIKKISLDTPERSGLSYKTQCPATLQPSETCNIIVTWQPTSKGVAQGVLVVEHGGKKGMSRTEITGDYSPVVGEKGHEGDVEMTPNLLDMGAVTDNAPLVKAILFSNKTSGPVTIKNIALDTPVKSGMSFKSQCPQTLQAGEACNMTVTWQPTSKGAAQGVLIVQHSGKSGLAQAEISGSFQPIAGDVTAEGNVEIKPDALDFGTALRKTPMVKSVILTNNTFKPVTVKKVGLDTSERSGLTYKSQCPATLQPDEACNIIVTWQPTEDGAAQGVLAVEHSGKTGMVQTEISGTFEPPAGEVTTEGIVEVKPMALDFGVAAGTVPLVKTIVLSNNTFKPVAVKNITLNTPETSGLTHKAHCPATLQPSETCNIIVTWQPTNKGLAQAVLMVEHGGKTGMTQSEITATFQPEAGDTAQGNVEMVPTALEFGNTTNNTSLVKSILLNNKTNSAITIKNIALDTPVKSGMTFKSQCPPALQAGESCNMIVTWQPTSMGPAQGVLVVQHTGKSGVAQSEINGTYQAPVGQERPEGLVEAKPEGGIDFGVTTGGIALVKAIVLSNDTLAPVTITEVTLDAPEKSGLSFKSQCPQVLPPEGTCNIVVSWLPMTKGLAQGVLAVKHSGKGGMTQSQIVGTLTPEVGQEVAEGTITIKPEALDFGASSSTMPLMKSVVFSNNTQKPLTIRNIELNTSEKSGLTYKSQCPQTLQAEESCNMIVTWLPVQKGPAQGVLVVQHNGKSGMTQVEVNGNYTPETVAAAAEEKVVAVPALLDFGTSPGGIAVVKSIIINNRTAKAINIKDITLDTPAQAGYTFKSQCPKTLQAAETCNIIVTWQPTSKGRAQGVLVVQHTGQEGLTQAEVTANLEPEKVSSAKVYPESVPDRGLLVSDMEQIDFGAGVGLDASITASLVNAGSSPLKFVSIRLAGKNNGLKIGETGCVKDMTLEPGEACPLTIAWEPARGGALLDSVQIAHTGTRGILVLPIKGGADTATVRPLVGLAGGTQGATVMPNGVVVPTGNNVVMPAAPGAPGVAVTNPLVSILSGGMPSRRTQTDMVAAVSNYNVTSHSAIRAVINGPAGGLVVRDGEDVVIEGMKWSVAIIDVGVALTNGKTEVLLPFDSSLKAIQQSSETVAGSTAAPAAASAASAAPAASSGAPSTTPPTLNDLQRIIP